MTDAVPLRLSARKLSGKELPPLLKSATRGADGRADDFLPADYLRPVAVYDVAGAARSAGDGAAESTVEMPGDNVLVIEMTDRSTLVTTAARLKASLLRSRPELVAPDGAILFDGLRFEAAASRGMFGTLAGALVSRVYELAVESGGDAILREASERAVKWAAARGVAVGAETLVLGIGRLGTKALMWAIERRLHAPAVPVDDHAAAGRDEPTGTLLRWTGGRGSAAGLEPDKPADVRKRQQPEAPGGPPKPMLVFVHGTASNTMGSFGDLRAGDADVWGALERRYTGGIYAFEHHTLSASPIDNARDLLAWLPERARVSLVSHSRGGLVCDLLCLDTFEALIDGYRRETPHLGPVGDADGGADDAGDDRSERLEREVDEAHHEHRRALRHLAAALRRSEIVVERYLRVASPGRGTKLASGNFDVFLSGILTLIGQVPFFYGHPAYLAFKRVVIEIAKNRTNPHVVPGIEAMLPDSPMARLLRDAPVRPGLQMAVIAGDIEGGHLLQRLGVLLADFLLYDNVDNDLVVDTEAMLAGIAPQAGASALFDRGSDVSHFRYFGNLDTRFALRDWLVAPEVSKLDAFQPLAPQVADAAAAERRRREIGSGAPEASQLPVVVVLPGVMGSHLWIDRRDRVWFEPADIARGRLERIRWSAAGVEAQKLFDTSYGDLVEHLSASHRVECFAYDWRQPLDVLGERFGEFLAKLLQTTDRPVRLLAHSMGGLVVRACIHRRPSVMDELMRRDGARFVMLGTPNQGSHAMVENLLGKGDTLRTLVRLDLNHTMKEVLGIVAEFPGPLQLLPKPGFVDTFQGTDEGGMSEAQGASYGSAGTWERFRSQVKDFWFGDGQSATPSQPALDSAQWLWKQDGDAPRLPAAYEPKTVYVCGVAPNTPCGVRLVKDRLKMVGTARGDGTVTWDSGRVGHIGRYYYMQAEHGALAATREHFAALSEILSSGTTARLAATPPAVRAVEQPRPVIYDAGPPTVEDAATLAGALVGGVPRMRLVARPKRRLEVAVRAMDLRFVNMPIMVGHYQHDPIAGPQKLIDRELLEGDLSERYTLGLYAGPRGTATVVLRAPNVQERRRGSLRGAVVTGLGPYERPLSLTELAEAVRAGALRYLLQVADLLGEQELEVPLAAVLLGYNSSANLTVSDSVEALVRGVLEANARFHETTRSGIRISRLDIVELYLDTAITAVYALRKLAPKFASMASRQRSMLLSKHELTQGEGVRQRLYDRGSLSYWPRLVVTDADRQDERWPGPARAVVAASAASATPATPAAPRVEAVAPVADRIRFLYVGQRARAESVIQQRQPGLVEALVRQQIARPQWNCDVGRMLFQLMVPNDFKDAARQIDRLVLVVDRHTANLPWELMASGDPDRPNDDLPLAIRTPVVRQLESSEFRRYVRQNFEPTALVVGNPSVTGCKAAFNLEYEPPPLDGAQQEAEAVVALLNSMGYTVTPVIGEKCGAADVLAALYRRPYRFVHISAHGVFDLLHRDGKGRTGVLLSDGLLVTAAEIDAMETVPELVFLNCCHVGKLEDERRDANRLAASVSRELIQIGVRCVIVAGWAVDDSGARLFGETFYRELLLERRAFGEAVFEARKAVWSARPDDITWGAFQAYGDAGWLAEPVREAEAWGSQAQYATAEEVLDELASLRASLSRRSARLTPGENETWARAVEQLCQRVPPAWLATPMLQSALGRTWADLNQLDLARKAYLAAVQAEDRRGLVPIRDVEQLANVEARVGEKQRNPRYIERALQRLAELDRLVADAALDHGPLAAAAAAPQRHAERSALKGSALKRLASLRARTALELHAKAADLGGASEAAMGEAGAAMRAALRESAKAYALAEGQPGQAGFSAYHALNRLSIEALELPPDEEAPEVRARRDAALALVHQCAMSAAEEFRREGTFFSAVIAPETQLMQRLIDRSFARAGDEGVAVLDEVIAAYRDALSNITLKPKELDSVVDHLCLLSRFHDAFDVVERDRDTAVAAEHRRAADRLIELAERLQPGACRRDDRPARRRRQGGAAPRPAPDVPAPAPSAGGAAEAATSGAPDNGQPDEVPREPAPDPAGPATGPHAADDSPAQPKRAARRRHRRDNDATE